MDVKIHKNTATVTIPANTICLITPMVAARWNQKIEVKIGSGSPTPHEYPGSWNDQCFNNLNIKPSSSSQTVELSFFQDIPGTGPGKGWQPSAVLTKHPSPHGELKSIFLAARDSGGSRKTDIFPNCSALVYFYVGYRG